MDLILTRRNCADLISPRTHSHHWPSEDCFVLRQTPEAQGDCRICCWDNPDNGTVAFSRLFGRALWDLCVIWRLLLDHRRVCRKYTHCGSLHTASIGQDWGRAKERRTTGMNTERDEVARWKPQPVALLGLPSLKVSDESFGQSCSRQASQSKVESRV